MHPVDHAKSTAVWLGLTTNEWSKFIAPHHWMDATKAVHAYIPHRYLRHHREGIKIYSDRNGGTLRYGERDINLVEMLTRHLWEDIDMDELPVVEDWLKEFNNPIWLPLEIKSCEELAENSAKHYGHQPEDWIKFHTWFLDNFQTSGYIYLAMRHHSWGIFDAEEEFGYTINNVPTRIVAETHVKKVMGRIPSTQSWLKHLPIKQWMSPSPSTVMRIKRELENNS